MPPEMWPAFPDWRMGRHPHRALAPGRCSTAATAARNMAGPPAEFTGVPFFWSEQFDVILQYVGYAALG